MGREDMLDRAIKEARERLWAERSNEPKRHKGESAVHYRRRCKRDDERVERREDVVKHLTKKRDALRDEKEEDAKPSGQGDRGFSVPDRAWNPYKKLVPNWMIPWLDKSRAAGWTGVVVSGVRTPAQSTGLCENMCGNPTCPGQCAGIYSNHNMEGDEGYPDGALDLTDYYDFERIQFQIGSPLRNDLPIDPVHFSVTGK